MVTPTGVLEKYCDIPRISCGPDFTHIVLGSEGVHHKYMQFSHHSLIINSIIILRHYFKEHWV